VQGQIEASSGAAGIFVAHAGVGLILKGLSGSNFTQVFSVDAGGNGFYAGNLTVTGKLTRGSGSFKIDHPFDPANKYLSHSFVESPDMMNVYNGNVTSDKRGLATVIMPEYFGVLNRDFRYQLTVIGQFAQAIVKQEIANNRFTIQTNKPSIKVSWQVTGIRQDAYANANRIPETRPRRARLLFAS
jgi:trimeric autotransporter adhesin